MSAAFALLNLPDSLHLEILSYVLSYDRREYARASRGFSSRLIKVIRDIVVGGKRGSNRARFLTSETLATEVLQLIHNPSQQLRVNAVGMELVPRESFVLSVLPRKVRSVISNIHLFSTTFQRHFKTIGRLELLGTYASQKHLSYMSSQLDRIAEAMRSDQLHIEEMNLIRLSQSSSSLPVFTGVSSLSIVTYEHLSIEGLRIPEYSNLKILRLSDCPNIKNVACLDSIYELHLDYCPNIEDISCLNHNHKIVILSCRKIRDYSKSFQFSSFIHIEGSFHDGEVNPIDMDHLQCAKTLIVKAHPIVLEKPLPESLRVLYVASHGTITHLPENQLTEVTISECKAFERLNHMKNIQRVHLIGLMELSVLDGLGHGNGFIEIRRCPFITDFTRLRNNTRLEIRQCDRCLDTGVLSHVKEVSFEPLVVGSPLGSEVHCTNFEAVTSLYLADVPMNSSILVTATRLSSLVVYLSNRQEIHDFDQHCLSFFQVVLALPSLRKVVLGTVEQLINGENRSHYQHLFDSFGYQMEHYQRNIVLLKKNPTN